MHDETHEFEQALARARAETRIVRARKNLLFTFGATRLPYICLSPVEGRAQVRLRQGEVTSQRPTIETPDPSLWSAGTFGFEGFDDASDDNAPGDAPGGGPNGGGGGGGWLPVLIGRRVELPPARYVNTPAGAGLEPGGVEEVIGRVRERLDREHDIRTGVLVTPEATWALGVLLYVGAQMTRSAPSNLAEHFERIRLNQP